MLFFFFNDTATTEIYTLSLHDALPISWLHGNRGRPRDGVHAGAARAAPTLLRRGGDLLRRRCRRSESRRSEEHTSELQSPCNLVCRLLLEKKKRQLQTTFHKMLYACYP